MRVTESIAPVMRFAPLVGIVLLFLVGVVWRSWLQRRRYGTWGVVHFGLGEPTQAALAAGLIIAFVLLAGQAFEAAFWPTRVHLQVRLSPQGALILSTTGVMFLVGGLALLVVAQLQMGASWRIGIDKSAPTALIDSGLFRYCRNPIYLALLVVVAGYVALLPTSMSLMVWAGAYLGIRLQIGAEETYLRRTCGEAYHVYTHRVGRLLPAIGRRP